MTEHIVEVGETFIRGLAELGNSLGYHVGMGYPGDKSENGGHPSVYLAWFSDESQKSPLIIFEMESAPTNTMANNVLQALGQENAQFESPLFFFHLIQSKESASTRIKTLERQHGTHGYRNYMISENGRTNKLIQDILAQHRRINREINYYELYEQLSDACWNGTVDPILALREASKLGFSEHSRLLNYVCLTLDYPHLVNELKIVLEEDAGREWISFEALPSWYGNELGMYPLCALMIRNSTTKTESIKWNAILRDWESNYCNWQLDSYCLDSSPDGNEFFLHVFPAFVALCVSVAGDRGEFRIELCDALTDVLEQMEPCTLGIEIASWLCNVSARCALTTQYNIAREYINNYGGISEALLYSPPSITSDESCDDTEQNIASNMIICPGIQLFRERAFSLHRQRPADPCQLALKAVYDENFVTEWSEPILSTLWDRSMIENG